VSKRDDALDRYLDALSERRTSQAAAADLDAPIAATARRLLGMRRAEPSPAFLATLEADLALRARSPRAFRPDATPNDVDSLTGPRPTASPPVSSRGTARPTIRLSLLAAALVIILGAGVLTVTRGYRDGDGVAFLPAAEVTAPAPAAVIDCAEYLRSWTSVQSWLSVRYNRLLFAQITSISRPSPDEPGETIEFIPASALPDGAPPSRITVAKINAAVAREYACAGTPSPMGADASFGHSAPSGAGASAELGETRYVTARPVQAVQTLLDADGRVGALVWDDATEGEVGTYFVFVPLGADWFLTEVAAVATDAYITAHPGAPLVDQVTIYVNDVRVISVPARFDLAAGNPVDISVVNDGSRERQFAIPSAGIELTLAPGEQRTVTVTLPAGGHRYTVDVNRNENLTSGGWFWAFEDVAIPAPTIEARPEAPFGTPPGN
jgi:hypothetical protein